jgi:Ferritin-like domain
MTDLPLDDLDRDGALVEAFDGLHGRTRTDLLRARWWAASRCSRRSRRRRPPRSTRARATSRSSTFLDFGGATEGAAAFQRTAVAFEDLSVAAYKAQVPRIVEREYLTSAMAIHSVEARHAAWIRRLAGQAPVAGPFDEPISRATTTRIVDRTHFVVRTTSRRGPRFTG